MGILSLVLGQSNPAAMWAAQNRGWLSNVGAGLAAGPTFSEGLAKAAQYGPAGQLIDEQHRKEEAEKAEREEAINQSAKDLAKFPDLMEAVASKAITPAAAYSEMWRRMTPGYGQENLTTDQQNFMFAQQNPEFASFLNSDQGDVTTGFTPIPGTYNGQDVFAFPGNDGRYYVDGQPVPAGSFKPTSQYVVNANKAAGTMFGKQTGDAQFDLPSAQLTVSQTVDALKEIRDNKAGMAEQFGNILGLPTQMIPARPGTAMADFRNSVTRGANLAFMQAREMLRGGGQITDFESKKAESAITDMQIAMESGSQPMFEKALNDFEQAVKDGYEKLKSQAAAIPGYSSTPAPSGNATSTGVQWSYEP